MDESEMQLNSSSTTVSVTGTRMGIISDKLFDEMLVMWPVLWFIIIPPGLCANGIIIRTFLRIGLNDSVTISFFVLAISDFAHLLFPLANVVLLTMNYLEEKVSTFFEIQPMALFLYVVNVVVMFNSWTSLITAFLAVQRCLCIAMPFHFKAVFTKTRTWRIMVVLGIYSILPNAAIISTFELKPIVVQSNRTQYVFGLTPNYGHIQRFVDIVLYLFTNMTCLGISFGSLIIMSYSLAASARFRKDATSTVLSDRGGKTSTVGKDENADGERQVSKERTAIVQVALLSAIYMVTNIPKVILAIGPRIEPEFGVDGLYNNFRLVAFYTRVTFDYLNSAVNFLVYYKYNSKFRKLCFDNSYGEKSYSK